VRHPPVRPADSDLRSWSPQGRTLGEAGWTGDERARSAGQAADEPYSQHGQRERGGGSERGCVAVAAALPSSADEQDGQQCRLGARGMASRDGHRRIQGPWSADGPLDLVQQARVESLERTGFR